MIDRKRFDFLTYKVIVEIRDNVPNSWEENACGGCYDELDDNNCFRLWFSLNNVIPSLKIISHECWHLFMTIMKHIDNHEHTFEELNNEIYAYNFHMLFSMVLDSLLDSKLYKKALSD